MRLLNRLRSVRSVLTLWYSSVILVAFCLFGGSVYFYIQQAMHDALEERLATEVEWIAERVTVGRDPVGMQGSQSYLPSDVRELLRSHLELDPRNYTVFLTALDGGTLYSEGGESIRSFIKRPSATGRTIIASIERGPGDTFKLASLSKGTFTLHLAIPEDNIRRVLRHVLSILVLLAPVAFMVSIAGGWIVSGVVLRPIGRITRMAERITAENLTERIPEHDVDDEIGRLIRALNLSIGRVEASFEQIKEFSSNVAHELKTPLTILRGEAELALAGEMTPAQAQELATTYLEETIRITNVVDDLLTLAKTDAGQIETVRDEVNFKELIDEINEEAEILASEKNLKVELLGNPPLTVIGSSDRLRRLFRSLISNAIRYTDPGGAIRIRSTRVAEGVLVEIEDTGIGIPAGSLPKIFDRFYRVDEARSRVTGGSGLGLSLAKSIAESHGGTITVASEPGAGSCFTVVLPLGGPTV